MEGLGVIGFVIGLVAFIRVEKLIRVLKHNVVRVSLPNVNFKINLMCCLINI